MAIIIYLNQKKVKIGWLSIVVGLLHITFGVWMLRNPLTSYASLSIVFSILIFLLGVLWIASSISVNDTWIG